MPDGVKPSSSMDIKFALRRYDIQSRLALDDGPPVNPSIRTNASANVDYHSDIAAEALGAS